MHLNTEALAKKAGNWTMQLHKTKKTRDYVTVLTWGHSLLLVLFGVLVFFFFFFLGGGIFRETLSVTNTVFYGVL